MLTRLITVKRTSMTDSPLNAALRFFEAAEANLNKAEKVLAEIEVAIPQGICFGNNIGYDSNCRHFDDLLIALPKIDGWKPEIHLLELNQIAQNRLDAQELGEIEYIVQVEGYIEEPSRLLAEYRHRFNKKRSELVRDSLDLLIDAVDSNIRELGTALNGNIAPNENDRTDFEQLKANIAQINTLLGSSVTKPPRWNDLNRHIHFGMLGDLRDIVEQDWPAVSSGLRKSLYGEKEPIPCEIEDLGALVRIRPRGPVATSLEWKRLDEGNFERLMFALISSEPGYENPEWLMKTNAPDRGRDLSVNRVYSDALSGVLRQRVIIQCKHWLTKSVGVSDISMLKEQMKLWEPPRVDVHVIATSGRFTSDAVALVEKHNQSDTGLRLEIWPESHLERLLASRPGIIAEFNLR